MLAGRVMFGACALLWGFLQAPFDHIHPGEELEHQSTSVPVHLHVHEALPAHGPALCPRTADDDEIDVAWNAAGAANIVLQVGGEVSERLPVPAHAITSTAIVPPLHRGHDPPDSGPQAPRAPPA